MASYSWCDGNEYIFMNTTTFEEVRVNKDIVDKSQFLVEGQEVKLMRYGEDVISVELPVVTEFTIVAIDPSNTWGANQSVTLNSGASIMAPMFVKEGSRIRVNTTEGTYVDRVDAS